MTKQHPLTDEMCKEIQLHIFSQSDEDCMRAAYDLAIKHVENVIELKLEVLDGEWRLDQYEISVAIEDFCKELIQTMRPQEDN